LRSFSALPGGLVLRAYPTPTFPALVTVIKPVGTLWVNAIRMTIVPLVMSLLVVGVASSGEMRVKICSDLSSIRVRVDRQL
jgi:Na+/H+-dicarboxylate symporter